MSEANIQPREIASAQVKVGNELCRLVLTEKFVSMHSKKFLFREAAVLIPLSSIDSISHGWQRSAGLLIVGVVLALAGVVMLGQQASGGGAVLFFGIAFLAAFWFYRPHLLLVRSTREALGGNPTSAPESQKFIDVLTEVLSRGK
ncbi:MAG: hypothetical protein HY923_06430 [Elusimicrobia bacterium]|nr:hypothetical protein [Elusimicrobiota bacterium]